MQNKSLHFLFSVFLHFMVIFFLNFYFFNQKTKFFKSENIKINIINFDKIDKSSKSHTQKNTKNTGSTIKNEINNKIIKNTKIVNHSEFSKNLNIKSVINEKYKNLEILNEEDDFFYTDISVLDEYIKNILNEIEKNKFYPSLAKFRKNEGNVDLIFYISMTGELLYIDIFRTSGYKILDEASINIIKAIKFSKFSDNMNLNVLKIKINFVFQLKSYI